MCVRGRARAWVDKEVLEGKYITGHGCLVRNYSVCINWSGLNNLQKVKSFMDGECYW
jgi:hypothetical protein